jgi:hypothetical protein
MLLTLHISEKQSLDFALQNLILQYSPYQLITPQFSVAHTKNLGAILDSFSLSFSYLFHSILSAPFSNGITKLTIFITSTITA